MDQNQSSERSIGFRKDFPDQWYELNNPDPSDSPMEVTLLIRRVDFPPNFERLKINHVVLYFSTQKEVKWNGLAAGLQFTEKGSTEPSGGHATPVDGVISTRRASASRWMPIVGKSPAGEWQLSFSDMKQLFKESKIRDILFVITFEGQPPAWPGVE